MTGVPRSPCFNKHDRFDEYTEILEQPFLAYKYNVKDEKWNVYFEAQWNVVYPIKSTEKLIKPSHKSYEDQKCQPKIVNLNETIPFSIMKRTWKYWLKRLALTSDFENNLADTIDDRLTCVLFEMYHYLKYITNLSPPNLLLTSA